MGTTGAPESSRRSRRRSGVGRCASAARVLGWNRMSRRERTAAVAVGAFVAVVFLLSVLLGGDKSWGAGGGDALRGGAEKRWVRLRTQHRVCDADAERRIAKDLQPFVNFSMNRLMHGDGRGNLAVTEVVAREKMPSFVPLRSDIDLATRSYTADTAKVLEMLSVAPFFRALRERPGQPLQRLLRFVKFNAPAPLVFRRSVVDKFETYSDNPKKFELRTGTMVYYGSLVNGSIYQGEFKICLPLHFVRILLNSSTRSPFLLFILILRRERALPRREPLGRHDGAPCGAHRNVSA